jgi:hypothetical protein
MLTNKVKGKGSVTEGKTVDTLYLMSMPKVALSGSPIPIILRLESAWFTKGLSLASDIGVGEYLNCALASKTKSKLALY